MAQDFSQNPYTPTFGEEPAVLAGRRALLAPVGRALRSETRRPELTTLISGARGTGKTSLLSRLGETAADVGWISVDVTASSEMLEDIELQTKEKAAHIVEKAPQARLSSPGGQLMGSGLQVGLTRTDEETNWRLRMARVLDQLERANSGLYITVDEVDPSISALKELATVYQHFIREGRRVGLLMAGLPGNVSTLAADDAASFLRRAKHYQIGRISAEEVKDGFRRTALSAGRDVEPEALEAAAEAIYGYPYLLQLVGYYAWDASAGPSLDERPVAEGVELARADFQAGVLRTTMRELSERDLDFLGAMLPDDGESAIADLTKRLGWNSRSMVSEYRRRLIDAGVIGARTRGRVGFEMPFLKDFLEEEL